MEGTVTGRGIEIKWTAGNPKQASSGASECFQRNVMTKRRRKDRPMWKMIGKCRGRAEKSGEERRRAAEVGEGRIMWVLAGAGYGRRISAICHLLIIKSHMGKPMSVR